MPGLQISKHIYIYIYAYINHIVILKVIACSDSEFNAFLQGICFIVERYIYVYVFSPFINFLTTSFNIYPGSLKQPGPALEVYIQ